MRVDQTLAVAWASAASTRTCAGTGRARVRCSAWRAAEGTTRPS